VPPTTADAQNKIKIVSRAAVYEALKKEGFFAVMRPDCDVEVHFLKTSHLSLNQWKHQVQQRVSILSSGEWHCVKIPRFVKLDVCKRCGRELLASGRGCGNCTTCNYGYPDYCQNGSKYCRELGKGFACKPKWVRVWDTIVICAKQEAGVLHKTAEARRVIRVVIMQILMSRKRKETLFALLPLDVLLIIVNHVCRHAPGKPMKLRRKFLQ
jgi:hypothetical protein